jgi:hypothetical protein
VERAGFIHRTFGGLIGDGLLLIVMGLYLLGLAAGALSPSIRRLEETLPDAELISGECIRKSNNAYSKHLAELLQAESAVLN